MASRRCSTCNVNYPYTAIGAVRHAECDICGEATSFIPNADAHPDWQEQVTWKRRDRWEAEQIADLIPAPNDEQELPIYEEGGLFWISDWELRRAGIDPPAVRHMWLFRANGHIWEAQGWDEPKRRWWIEEVCLEDGGGKT